MNKGDFFNMQSMVYNDLGLVVKIVERNPAYYISSYFGNTNLLLSQIRTRTRKMNKVDIK